MSYVRVPGEGLRTSYALAPTVVVDPFGESRLRVTMSFISSPLGEDGVGVTTLRFNGVTHFAWYTSEHRWRAVNAADGGLCLIEISDSQILGAIDPQQFPEIMCSRHYRISFDHHGSYDVVCEELDVSRGREADAERFHRR